MLGWILIGEDFLRVVFEEKDLRKAVKELEEERDFEVVELKHEWGESLESLEKYVLNNSEILLKYPFFNKRVKQENISIQEYVLNYLKRLTRRRTWKLFREIISEETVEINPGQIRELIVFFKFRYLLVFYNLIQGKIREEIKGTPKVRSIEAIPGNSVFINLQNLDKEVIKNSKTRLIFKPSENLSVFQKATLLSLYYAILYCIKEGINQVAPNMFLFTLSNLMEVIGLPKREWGEIKRGYSHELKEEVLWLLTNVISKPYLAVNVKELDTQARKGLKELLGDFYEESDLLYFNPFGIIYNVLTTKEKNKIIIKDAIIKIFVDNSLNVEAIRTFKSKVFKSKLNDPYYRLLAIWLDTGSRFGKKVITTPKDLLKVAEVEIDYRHPERTKKRLGSMLDRAKDEGIIKDYEIEEYSKGSFKDWLESKYIIFFDKEGGNKKR